MNEPMFAAGAGGYDKLYADATQSFIPALLRAAHIEPGHHVLDVATGTGVAAAAAASQVGSNGSVIAGDISRQMLEVAERNLKDKNIRLELVDGQKLPYGDDEFHAVICQLGLMLFDDPSQGLREFYRVLKPNGWTAVSTTTTPERLLYGRIIDSIARHIPAKAAMLRKFFSISSRDQLESLLNGARFVDIDIQFGKREFTFSSMDDYFDGPQKGLGLTGQEFTSLSRELQGVVRSEVEASLAKSMNGQSVVIEMEVMIGCGRK